MREWLIVPDPRPSWHRLAACAGDERFWETPLRGSQKLARLRAVCHGCPVRDACLTAALAEEAGRPAWTLSTVRGGLLPAERHKPPSTRR
ncbi:WhiB family transcriptional regulator [Luteimicrobium sp. DT211]|uniref:WhiB family transcriptional regulator n=1 Tax=Luteimicrobium sp. DT211 TaxID=3393412 RepID=UPI003CEB087B